MWNILVFLPFGLPGGVRNYVLRTLRTLFRLPFETFQDPFIFLKLDGRVSVTFYLLIVQEIIEGAFFESGGQHLGFELVDRRERVFLL